MRGAPSADHQRIGEGENAGGAKLAAFAGEFAQQIGEDPGDAAVDRFEDLVLVVGQQDARARSGSGAVWRAIQSRAWRDRVRERWIQIQPPGSDR